MRRIALHHRRSLRAGRPGTGAPHGQQRPGPRRRGRATPLMSSNVVQLFLFFLYAVGANTLLHLPTEPAVLTAAKHHSDVLVVLFRASAAARGEYLNLLFLRRLYLSRVLEAVVVKNVLFQKSLRWFQIAPFSVTVIFAFTPLPFDVIRLLAPASSFPLASYLAAVVCGRTPRYVRFSWFR